MARTAGRLGTLVALALWLVPATAHTQDGFELVVDGFGFAVNMAIAPDGSIFVADKDVGEIRIVREGAIMPEPFAKLPALVTVNETGLLGVALHPDFPVEPWVYAYFTDATDGRNRLVRIRAEGDHGTEVQTLMDLLPATSGWHNGGDLTFGSDGKLYVSVGDGHDGQRAQDPNGIGGRVLRLEPDGSIPQDNPFGPDDPTFALGIRNSFGLCVDGLSGALWETENGPTEWDEINLLRAGGNYGWPVQLGPGGAPGFVDPVLAFREPIVVTGCAGDASNGGLFFGEGYSGRLHRMQVPPEDAADPLPRDEIVATFDGGVTDVARTPDGSVWVVTPTAVFRSASVLLPAPTPTISASIGPTEAIAETAAGASGATGGSPSAAASPPGEEGRNLVTGAGLLVLAAIVGGLLLMRRRLLRG